MTDPTPPRAPASETPDELQRARLGAAAVLIISLTAILTAWTSFEAGKWGGEETQGFAEAGSLQRLGEGYYADAGQKASIDAQLFVAWLEATVTGDDELADVIEERFPDTLDDAVDQWLDTQPFDDPDAPRTPFEEFAYPDDIEGDAVHDESAQRRADAIAAGAESDKYSAMAIGLALVILFAALADKVPGARTQRIMIAASVVGLVVGIVVVASLPKLL